MEFLVKAIVFLVSMKYLTTPDVAVEDEAPPSNGWAGAPNAQKEKYGMPTTLKGGHPANRQMVWGPGEYGFLKRCVG